MAEVHLDTVRKTFGRDVVAVDDVELDVGDGGPSGCGKTTLLRCLAGLERVDSGRVLIGGRDVTSLPPHARRLAMVFQSYAVFPHPRVGDNIAFGLRMQKEKDSEVKRRVARAAELLRIDHLLDRFPAQLSGGQRQRVAVARTIATRADVLLMDEPLSNLDALLRLEARAELKRLISEFGVTTIYVTHDQIDAMSMGNRIAVMNDGRLVQVDSPLTVYDHPADTFVGGFIGNPPMNFVVAEIVGGNGTPIVQLSGGSFALPVADVSHLAARRLMLGSVPRTSRCSRSWPMTWSAPACWSSSRSARTTCSPFARAMTYSRSQHGADLFPAIDSDVWLRMEPARIRWMDGESRQAIVS